MVKSFLWTTLASGVSISHSLKVIALKNLDRFTLITASVFEKFADSNELTKYRNSVCVVTELVIASVQNLHEIVHTSSSLLLLRLLPSSASVIKSMRTTKYTSKFGVWPIESNTGILFCR